MSLFLFNIILKVPVNGWEALVLNLSIILPNLHQLTSQTGLQKRSKNCVPVKRHAYILCLPSLCTATNQANPFQDQRATPPNLYGCPYMGIDPY